MTHRAFRSSVHLFVLALAFASLTILVACPNTPYGKAGKLGLDVTDTIHTGADTIDQLRLNGTITKDDEKDALNYLDAANTVVTGPYARCVKAAHEEGNQPAAFAACASTLSADISDPMLLTKFHVVNPKSQDAIRNIVRSANNLIQVAITGFSGK